MGVPPLQWQVLICPFFDALASLKTVIEIKGDVQIIKLEI